MIVNDVEAAMHKDVEPTSESEMEVIPPSTEGTTDPLSASAGMDPTVSIASTTTPFEYDGTKRPGGGRRDYTRVRMLPSPTPPSPSSPSRPRSPRSFMPNFPLSNRRDGSTAPSSVGLNRSANSGTSARANVVEYEKLLLVRKIFLLSGTSIVLWGPYALYSILSMCGVDVTSVAFLVFHSMGVHLVAISSMINP
ncbi:hypothetical protein HK102_012206, partial [Quaeritorhiza haematococci]